VQKSQQFAGVGVVAFNLANISAEMQNELAVFEITDTVYTRKNIAGATRFLKEYLSGIKKWHSQLFAIINNFKPDIIHCHFGTMGITWMDFELKFKTGIPYVTSFYGYDASSLPLVNLQYRKNLDRLWLNGTAFFAEGPELKNKLIALGCPNKKCLINPLLIPVEDYPVKTSYRQPGQPARFLFVGRFVEKKGFHLFLTAIGRLKGNIEKFTIDVIGSGTYEAVYKNIIAQYGLQENINWLGIKSHEDIINTLKDYDFLVHPSMQAIDNDSEGGAPSIIIEAQAAGLPVITSNHADIPFIMGYADFITPENNIDLLITTIQSMLNRKDIVSYALKGINKVHQQHDLTLNNTYRDHLLNLTATY
jgi:glycosyltransferase involved in cell wall biosynthesis